MVEQKDFLGHDVVLYSESKVCGRCLGKDFGALTGAWVYVHIMYEKNERGAFCF